MRAGHSIRPGTLAEGPNVFGAQWFRRSRDRQGLFRRKFCILREFRGPCWRQKTAEGGSSGETGGPGGGPGPWARFFSLPPLQKPARKTKQKLGGAEPGSVGIGFLGRGGGLRGARKGWPVGLLPPRGGQGKLLQSEARPGEIPRAPQPRAGENCPHRTIHGPGRAGGWASQARPSAPFCHESSAGHFARLWQKNTPNVAKGQGISDQEKRSREAIRTAKKNPYTYRKTSKNTSARISRTVAFEGRRALCFWMAMNHQPPHDP